MRSRLVAGRRNWSSGTVSELHGTSMIRVRSAHVSRRGVGPYVARRLDSYFDEIGSLTWPFQFQADWVSLTASVRFPLFPLCADQDVTLACDSGLSKEREMRSGMPAPNHS